jgi:SAM-dependent methyltransferase
MSTTPSSGPDHAAISQRQREIWSEGDFSAIAGIHVIVSELLCEAVDLHAGRTVLDVACGSGNTALAAAHRGCEVTGTDIVPALLERAQERAAIERLPIHFELGDAQRLPYPDRSFDVVLSTFGAMFAPDQARAAAEMVRVCRPDGTIGMANWTPEGWIGIQFATINGYAPRPAGLPSPFRWGTEAGLRELFGDRIGNLTINRRTVALRYRSPAHWLDVFRANLGPMAAAFAALDRMGRQLLADDLLDRITAANTATDGTLVVPAEYLEVVATRR